jgi:PadR family transcriptional regulator, regulatory protein PadR
MPFSKELLKGSIEIVVLQVLADEEEAYGYQLLSAIQEVSGDIFQFQESTLYPLLYRFEDKGYVESEIKHAPSGKERRYYHLTAAGKRVLQDKLAEFKLFLKGMGKILKSQGHA